MPSIFKLPSEAFDVFFDTPVAFHGTRPGARPLALAVKCMVDEDAAATAGGAFAPTNAHMFNVTLPHSSWKDATPPQIGEWMKVVWCGSEMWLKAEHVGHLPDGDFCIVAEWKPERRPIWLP